MFSWCHHSYVFLDLEVHIHDSKMIPEAVGLCPTRIRRTLFLTGLASLMLTGFGGTNQTLLLLSVTVSVAMLVWVSVFSRIKMKSRFQELHR